MRTDKTLHNVIVTEQYHIVLCLYLLQEQAKQSEEQAKKMEERTELLAGEVASLREALEKLVAQMAAK